MPTEKKTPRRKTSAAAPPAPTASDEQPARRPPPPIVVPPAIRYGGGMASARARDLNVMLSDLEVLRGPITSHYTNNTRNGVSLVQQKLMADGYFAGPPDGNWTEATRQALLAHPDITTIE